MEKFTRNAIPPSTTRQKLALERSSMIENRASQEMKQLTISFSRSDGIALTHHREFKRRTIVRIALAIHTIEMIPKSMILNIYLDFFHIYCKYFQMSKSKSIKNGDKLFFDI